MREITKHHVNECNNAIQIIATDEPGSGGANHVYEMSYASGKTNDGLQSIRRVSTVCFQNGPIREVGVNGFTHEALLAIIIDRLESFQQGPFVNQRNANALGYLNLALTELNARTLERTARGVEGTHTI